MKHKLTVSIVALVMCLLLGFAETKAELTHALALYGKPKYGAGFTHFDYANPAAPKGKGTLRIGLLGTFDTLNPFALKGIPAEAQSILVFERLFDRSGDEPFTLYGRLAHSVDMPEDRSSITIHLRPEARFQDGTPVTADDVIFSWQTLKNKGRPHLRLFYGKVTNYQKLNERTVKFDLQSGGDRELPLLICYMPILSKVYYSSVEFQKATLKPPLGSGPYLVEDVKPGRAIHYKRNPNYWGDHIPVIKGQYNFQHIHYDYFRSDDVAAFESFIAGEFDFWEENRIDRWSKQYTFPAIRRGEVKRLRVPPRRTVGMYGFVFNTRKPLFADRRVREALTYGLDYEWLNKTYFYGDFNRIYSYFAGTNLSAKPQLTKAEQLLVKQYENAVPEGMLAAPLLGTEAGKSSVRGDLSKASSLLKEAGWVIKDNVLVNKQTREPFEFEILLVQPVHERIALALKQNLSRLGITVKIRSLDPTVYEKRRVDYDYDMVIHRWEQTRAPGQEQFYYWGMNAAKLPGSRNYAGVSMPLVDKLITHMTKTNSYEEYLASINLLDRSLQYGRYVIPLFQLKNDLISYRDKFGMPAIYPSSGFAFPRWWAILTWWDKKAAEPNPLGAF